MKERWKYRVRGCRMINPNNTQQEDLTSRKAICSMLLRHSCQNVREGVIEPSNERDKHILLPVQNRKSQNDRRYSSFLGVKQCLRSSFFLPPLILWMEVHSIVYFLQHCANQNIGGESVQKLRVIIYSNYCKVSVLLMI